MSFWVFMLAAGLTTFLTRLSFIGLEGRWEIPATLKRGLRFVPPAVFSAIVFPDVFMQGGQLSLTLDNSRLVAGLAAGLVAWKTKNSILTVVVGMAVLWLLQVL